MAIQNVTLSQLDPTFLTLAKAGIQPTLNAEQFKAYSTLFEILTGEKWDQETYPVLSVFGGKIYLPKLYNAGGKPGLQWGTKLILIEQKPNLAYSYSTASTGYSAPHLALLFTPDKSVKETKTLYQVYFPISLESGEQVAGDFLTLAPVAEDEALNTYVRKPDPTTGLDWLDDFSGDAKELDVVVLSAVTRKGDEQWGGKPFTTATVICPSIDPEKVFKVRTNTDANATLQGPLKFPLNVAGTVKRAKKNLNLQGDIQLTPDNLDMSKLG